MYRRASSFGKANETEMGSGSGSGSGNWGSEGASTVFILPNAGLAAVLSEDAFIESGSSVTAFLKDHRLHLNRCGFHFHRTS